MPSASSRVALGFDGAWSGDSTGIVGCTVPTPEQRPHLFVVGAWERPPGTPGWRVPVATVEQTVRLACEHLNVAEVACDPHRWGKSLQDLADEGLPMSEFRTNELARMVPACQAFEDAVLDGLLTHDGDPRLARHIENAQIKADARGTRIVKEHKASTRHIDLAVAAVVAYARAITYGVEESAPAFYDLDDFLEDDL